MLDKPKITKIEKLFSHKTIFGTWRHMWNLFQAFSTQLFRHKLTSRIITCVLSYLLFLSISKAENNVVFYLLTFTETVTKFKVNNLAAFRTELDAFNISMASRINLVRVHYRCYRRQAVTVLLSIRTFAIDAIHFFLRHLSCIT